LSSTTNMCGFFSSIRSGSIAILKLVLKTQFQQHFAPANYFIFAAAKYPVTGLFCRLTGW